MHGLRRLHKKAPAAASSKGNLPRSTSGCPPCPRAGVRAEIADPGFEPGTFPAASLKQRARPLGQAGAAGSKSRASGRGVGWARPGLFGRPSPSRPAGLPARLPSLFRSCNPSSVHPAGWGPAFRPRSLGWPGSARPSQPSLAQPPQAAQPASRPHPSPPSCPPVQPASHRVRRRLAAAARGGANPY